MRPLHHRHRRRRSESRWGFSAVVALVAVVAFLVALRWPSGHELTPVGAVTPERDRFTCVVAYVNDGDTLRCMDGTRVRLHAVAARETDETCSPGHPCPEASAASATSELRRLVDGQRIACEPVGSSYNRVTAICWTPAEVEVNCAMVRSGTAVIWDRFNRERRICRR